MLQRYTIGILAAVAIVVALAAVARATRQTGPVPAPRTRASDIREAFVRGGLHEAARASGGHYKQVTQGHYDMEIADLETLARMSDAVIVGQVVGNRSHISNDGRRLTTDFSVVVGEVLGGYRSLEQIVVAIPGGRVEFPDGTSAEVTARGTVLPQQAGSYVMFLKAADPADTSDGQREWASGTQGVFYLAGGAVGLYELPVDGKVKPSSRKADPVVKKARGKAAKDFLHDVQRALNAVGRKPGLNSATGAR